MGIGDVGLFAYVRLCLFSCRLFLERGGRRGENSHV